jgi:hypothetical protein
MGPANTIPSGMNLWRARCGESRTPGSEGGPEKRTSRKAGTAPRSDLYSGRGDQGFHLSPMTSCTWRPCPSRSR